MFSFLIFENFCYWRSLKMFCISSKHCWKDQDDSFSDYVKNHPYSTNGLGGYCATVRHEVISRSTNATRYPFYCIFCIIKLLHILHYKMNIWNIFCITKRIYVTFLSCNMHLTISLLSLITRHRLDSNSNNTTSILGDHVPWIRLFQYLIVSKNYKC